MRRWVIRILLCLLLGAITTVAVAWGIAVADREPLNVSTSLAFVDHGDVAWNVELCDTIGRRRIRSVAICDSSRHNELREYLLIDARAGIPIKRAEEIPLWSRVHDVFDPGEYERSALYAAVEYAVGFPCQSVRCNIFDASIGMRRNLSQHPSVTMTDDSLTSTNSDGQQEVFKLAPGDGIEGGILLGIEFDSMEFPKRVSVLPLRPIWPGFVIGTLFYAVIWFGVFFGFASAKRFIRAKRGHCPRCRYDLRGNLAAGCPECGWGRAVSNPRE